MGGGTSSFQWSDLFFKARCELPPGTTLYADLAAFFEFISWTPEAQRNGQDPSWCDPRPDSEPGVYILEASSVSTDLSAPACLLPRATTSVSRDLSAPGVSLDRGSNSAADMSSSAGVPCDLDSSAALGTIALVDSSKCVVFDAGSQFLVDDSSCTASAVAFGPVQALQLRLFHRS